MVTILGFVGGSMTLGLAFACVFGRAAAQADEAREAAFARYLHDAAVEPLRCPALNDAAAGDAAAPVPDPQPHALVAVPSNTAQAWA